MKVKELLEIAEEEINEEDIYRNRPADNRGRVTLGSEYAHDLVTVVVVESISKKIGSDES